MKKTVICIIIAIVLVVGGISVVAFNRENARFNKNLNLTEEQVQILKDKIKEDILEMADAEEITQEQYDALSSHIDKGNFNFMSRGFKGDINKKKEIPEMTEEEKEKMKQKHIEMLKERLEKCEITQEQYDEMLKKAENGEFMPFSRGKMPRNFDKKFGSDGERPEFSMGEMRERFKEGFDKEMGSDGERPMPPMGRGFRGGRGKGFGQKSAEE